MGTNKHSHCQCRQNNMHLFTPDPSSYSTQLALPINNTTLPMNINAKLLGLTSDINLTDTYNLDITRKTIQILKVLTPATWEGGTKRNNSSHIQNHNKTRTRLLFNIMVTTNIHHKRQQTTHNTDYRIQRCNWVHTQQLQDETHILPIKVHI